ncbi:lipase family protein [Nocardioides nitrophenolicus]|uniref:lipase family protein n=1 Tax=Nocardioides nitrophenolicus TaxID=60489 RepID=UPI00195F12FD|nr:lipase family protein [Nocardioides nitrophenolicus]MBM7517738.1 hypothetical protein [Nocardioides nitrophenolicus]
MSVQRTGVGRGTALVPPPSLDPFYGPVATVPAPGTVIRSRRVVVLHEAVAAGWQLVYASTGARGQRIAVSGTVLLPCRSWRGPGERPLLSYGVGVHGLDRDAAPSHLIARGAEPELDLVAGALDRGWAVAISDGDGLGMPGPHTYGAGAPGGHALLDIVRAAPVAVPRWASTPPTLLWGYSEGGRCAAWAAELQPSYAPDVALVALAAGGVPADLRKVVEAIDGGPFSGLGLAVLVGLAHAHQDPALLRILSTDGRAAAERAALADVVGLVVEHPQPMREHTVRDEPWEEPVWRALLDRERNGGRAPAVPAYLYTCAATCSSPPRWAAGSRSTTSGSARTSPGARSRRPTTSPERPSGAARRSPGWPPVCREQSGEPERYRCTARRRWTVVR